MYNFVLQKKNYAFKNFIDHKWAKYMAKDDCNITQPSPLVFHLHSTEKASLRQFPTCGHTTQHPYQQAWFPVEWKGYSSLANQSISS